MAHCQICEYLCERVAYSCCVPSAIYLLFRAEAACGSFTHFSRLDVESHLKVCSAAQAQSADSVKEEDWENRQLQYSIRCEVIAV